MDQTLRAARAGDPGAMADLVLQLHPRLTRMAGYFARRTGEPADDLLQEAWRAVLETLPRLDLDIGSPQQHLLKRARWRMLSVARAARLRRCERLPDVLLQSDPTGPAAVVALDLADLQQSLCATQRAVLSGLLDGLTWRQIGQVLGCTSANVAYHVRKIRQRWREREEHRAEPQPCQGIACEARMNADERHRLAHMAISC